MTYLDLSLNKLSRLDSTQFNGLTELKYLGLEGNQISEIDRNTFTELIQLGRVCFKSNPIGVSNPELIQATFCGHRTSTCEVMIEKPCCNPVFCEIPV